MRELRKVPQKDLERIDARIRGLATDPRPSGSKKLKAPEELFRVRTGDYRVVYQIDDTKREVTVVRVGHRGEVYRGY